MTKRGQTGFDCILDLRVLLQEFNSVLMKRRFRILLDDDGRHTFNTPLGLANPSLKNGHGTIPFHNGTLGNPRSHMQILLFRKTDLGLRFTSCCLQLDCLNAIPKPQLNKRGTLKNTLYGLCPFSIWYIGHNYQRYAGLGIKTHLFYQGWCPPGDLLYQWFS